MVPGFQSLLGKKGHGIHNSGIYTSAGYGPDGGGPAKKRGEGGGSGLNLISYCF